MQNIPTKFEKVNLFFQDESRFGLLTRNGKALTACGVKPICPFHQIFKTLYLFGAFSPVDGKHFLLELPECNGDMFQIYLNEFSNQDPEEYKIIVLDNGAFHKAKTLKIPENICLLFLPPYSPELNPAENMWGILKRKFTNKLFNTLEEISDFLYQECVKLKKDDVKRTCDFGYISMDINWAI
jgi:transposase